MSTYLRRSVATALSSLALAGVSQDLLASGIDALAAVHAAPAKRAVAASAPEAAAPAQAKAQLAASGAVASADGASASKSPPKPRVVQNPMDVVRERLAEKIGGAKAAEPVGPNVLKVMAKSSIESEHRSAPASADGGTAAMPRPVALHRGSRVMPTKTEAAHEEPAAHWDYQGAGAPDSWGRLKPEFSKCSTGTRQSPIDIRDGIKVQLDPVQFSYRPSGFNVVDNGHTVQVNVGAGNSIEVMGRRYELLQFHFHRPSEERIDGRQFDMVVHLVHKDVDGKLAVVAVLLDRGSAHPIVQSVWNNLPLEKGDTVAAKTALDLDALLPKDRRYFTYMGSLTTPPCSEGVLWMVMKDPVPISSEQIGIFSRLYPMNARPIQQASGRLIKESN